MTGCRFVDLFAGIGGMRLAFKAQYKKSASWMIAQAGRNPRMLTPRECARVMGFPDSFR